MYGIAPVDIITNSTPSTWLVRHPLMDYVRLDALKLFMFHIAVAFPVNVITIGVAVGGEALSKRSDHLGEPEPVEKVEHDVSTSVHHNIKQRKLVENAVQRLPKVV